MKSQRPDRILKIAVSIVGISLLGLLPSCAHEPPPPTESAVPSSPTLPGPGYPADYPKPMPDQSAGADLPAPAYSDPPIVDQRLPEEANFVSAYMQVNRPRVAVFVNRTLDGALITPGQEPLVRTDTVKSATGGVDVQHSEGSSYDDWYHSSSQRQKDKFKSNGPAEYHESTAVYLQPGQYDEAQLQALDYSEMESLLTNWMSCSGKVTILSPSMIRAHLNQDQLKDLQTGKEAGLKDLGQALQADVLVQVTAHPVRREDRVVVLLIAEAVNINGGESIAQASVEMPTPITRTELNNFTRFLVRKTIDGMIGTWSSAPPPETITPAPQGLPSGLPTTLPAK